MLGYGSHPQTGRRVDWQELDRKRYLKDVGCTWTFV